MATSTPRGDLAERRLHPSLVRPILPAGIERELAIPLVGVVLALLFAFRPNVVTPLLALVVVTVVFPRLRALAKRDPQAFAALKGHMRLAGYYPAYAPHGSPRRRVPTL